jgi:transposase
MAFYCQTKPLPLCGRWTLRWAEAKLKDVPTLVGKPMSHSTIQRILTKNNLKPHLSKYFLHITDPDFFPKMEHLIPLYKNPSENLFCFDECPGIQILQRLAPDLITDEMRQRLEEFEYARNGTMDVFAFLQVKTGKVFAECRPNHQKEILIEVFEKQLKTLPKNEKIHYIMDNLASHSCYELCILIAKYSYIECPTEKVLNTAEKRREWLQCENKRIVFHYTPFHGSWLNMVEIWFGILNQKCLNESYDSAESMYKALYAFFDEWSNLLYHPFKWNYDGNGLHQKAVKRFIKIFENSREEMRIQFFIKQFLLMANLVETYWEKVSFESWIKLNEVINARLEQLNNMISKDEGPRRKEKAKQALKNLVNILNIRIEIAQKKTA